MSPTRLLALASLAFVPALALAQGQPRPDPLDPNAPTTALNVPRTFDDYARYQDPKVTRWQDTNKAAADDARGGMPHDMHDMAPAPASAPKPASSGGHAGHKM